MWIYFNMDVQAKLNWLFTVFIFLIFYWFIKLNKHQQIVLFGEDFDKLTIKLPICNIF